MIACAKCCVRSCLSNRVVSVDVNVVEMCVAWSPTVVFVASHVYDDVHVVRMYGEVTVRHSQWLWSCVRFRVVVWRSVLFGVSAWSPMPNIEGVTVLLAVLVSWRR